MQCALPASSSSSSIAAESSSSSAAPSQSTGGGRGETGGTNATTLGLEGGPQGVQGKEENLLQPPPVRRSAGEMLRQHAQERRARRIALWAQRSSARPRGR
jgi:hypothetical protein